MNPVDILQVQSNLCRLFENDFEGNEVISQKWKEFHHFLLAAYKGRKKVIHIANDQQLLLESGNSFFVTFHFGLYADLIKHLSEVFEKQITCIIAKQEHIEQIEALAANTNTDVAYVQITHSFKFLKELRKHRQKGNIFIAFCDIPLGVSDKLDSSHDFIGGKLKSKSGLFKIAKKLGYPDVKLVTSVYREQENIADLGCQAVGNMDDCIKKLEKLVMEKPYQWDKLSDLHMFYTKRKTNNLHGMKTPAGCYLYSDNTQDFFEIDEKSFGMLDQELSQLSSSERNQTILPPNLPACLEVKSNGIDFDNITLNTYR